MPISSPHGPGVGARGENWHANVTENNNFARKTSNLKSNKGTGAYLELKHEVMLHQLATPQHPKRVWPSERMLTSFLTSSPHAPHRDDEPPPLQNIKNNKINHMLLTLQSTCSPRNASRMADDEQHNIPFHHQIPNGVDQSTVCWLVKESRGQKNTAITSYCERCTVAVSFLCFKPFHATSDVKIESEEQHGWVRWSKRARASTKKCGTYN